MSKNRKSEVDAAIKDVDFSKNNYQVQFDTTKGKIVLALWPDLAPGHCKNIIGLSKIGFYDGVTFHRVISGFMIQGGDPLGLGTGGPGFEFDDEFHPDAVFTGRYQLAMAKSGDDTNGSQFFVTDSSPRHLDFNHTIFGQLVRVPIGFGGTSLMIVVGVALDTVNQIEAHLITRSYEGLTGPGAGRLRGRRLPEG